MGGDYYGTHGSDYIDLRGWLQGAFVDAGNGSDVVIGTAFNDIIRGGGGADWLGGGAGSDYLQGNDGNDVLVGGEGNDNLAGGKGIDRLYGGSNIDSFIFKAEDLETVIVSLVGLRGAPSLSYQTYQTDIIKDFQPGIDSLVAVDLLMKATNIGFNFTQQEAIDQGYIYWLQDGNPLQGGGTTVYIDRDGGTHNPNGILGSADWAIAHLGGVYASQINANDF